MLTTELTEPQKFFWRIDYLPTKHEFDHWSVVQTRLSQLSLDLCRLEYQQEHYSGFSVISRGIYLYEMAGL